MNGLVVCMHEDRETCGVGVRLAVLSILRHCPGLPIVVSLPAASRALRSWVDALPHTTLLDEPRLTGSGWNVKPTILLHLLSQGYEDVVWMDSDIIVTSDVRDLFSKFDNRTLVVTSEFYWGQQQGGNHRTVAWGLEPGTSLPCTANTGIVRVTRLHVDLLRAWQNLLADPAYRDGQTRPTECRPLAMVGDQDVLTAILGSRAFAHVPVAMLKRGVHVAQCYSMAGYTLWERLMSIGHGLPAFVHAMGPKPWLRPSVVSVSIGAQRPFHQRLRAHWDHLHLELSPYSALSQEYRSQLGALVDSMAVRSTVGRILVRVFGGRPALYELPFCVIETCVRRIRQVLVRYRVKPNSTPNLAPPPQ
jgi:hypothetical protein